MLLKVGAGWVGAGRANWGGQCQYPLPPRPSDRGKSLAPFQPPTSTGRVKSVRDESGRCKIAISTRVWTKLKRKGYG
jgi:hypothetical protein